MLTHPLTALALALILLAGGTAAALDNHGDVSYDYSGGTDIAVDDGYRNFGTVTATGVGGGDGIYVASGEFVNSGMVTARGVGSGGTGIYVSSGGFVNSGMVTATGESSGRGIQVFFGGFVNSGVLGLGEGIALSMGANVLRFTSGSVLALGKAGGSGGRISVNNTSLEVEPGAQLLAPAMAGSNAVDGASHTFNFLVDYDGVIAPGDLAALFGVGDGPVLRYEIVDNSGGEYAVNVTRKGVASALVGGNAGSFLRALETALGGAFDTTTFDPSAPYYTSALLRTFIDSQPTVDGVRRAAARIARERTPQATAGAVPMLADTARRAPALLGARLREARALREGRDAAHSAVAGIAGRAYASMTPGYGASRLVWASPFYQYGKYDAASRSGWSDLKENAGGVSLGMASSADGWAWAAAGHYIYSDIDGGGEYSSRSHGYGASAAAGTSFAIGSLCPWLEASAGYTRYRMEQTRTTTAVLHTASSSRPDLDVFTASASASNDFAVGSVILTPSLGVDWAHTLLHRYGEGGGVLSDAMQVSRKNVTSFRGVAGVAARWRLGCVEAEARASYRYEFADTQTALSWRSAALPTGMTTHGRDVGRSSAVLGLGAAWRAADRVSLRVDYDLTLGKRYAGHRVVAAVGVRF